jgi:hypothetical protein
MLIKLFGVAGQVFDTHTYMSQIQYLSIDSWIWNKSVLISGNTHTHTHTHTHTQTQHKTHYKKINSAT